MIIHLKKFLLTTYLLSFTQIDFSQLVLEQSICNCGVTGAGFSSGLGFGSGEFDIYIEPGSTIRNAYLFTYRIGYAPSTSITLNDVEIAIDTSSFMTKVNGPHEFATPVFLYSKDITNIIDPSITHYNITIPEQLNLQINWAFWTTYLLVVYENNNLSKIGYNIVLNNQNYTGSEFFEIMDVNPINRFQPVGLSIYSDRLGNNIFNMIPSHKVFFNSNLLGVIGGIDNVNSNFAGGVKGHFYHQNSEFFGLDDDIPDNVMDSTDAIANVSQYIMNFQNSFTFKIEHINFPNQTVSSNGENLALFLTYSTPCDTFSVTHSPDTTICPNETVQLFASGGTPNSSNTGYQWLADGSETLAGSVLSCTDCPNPIFTGDKSTLLTVRIWNNDSCSVVRPIKVNVRPKPSLSNITTTNTDCGTDNGKVVLSAQTPIASYRLDNGTPQVGITFNDLSEGLHNLQLTDAFGCVADTFFTIKDTIRTVAKYYPSPGFGYLPLEVDFLNQSTQATDYDWRINDTYIDELNTYIFDSSGTYEVTLYAWQFDESCVDSFTLKIMVYDNFSFSVPNIFTPNDDGKNDFFGITTSNKVEVNYEIYNRWGGLVAKGTKSGKGFVVLWDGSTFPPLEGDQGGGQGLTKGGSQLVTDGTYFYKLSLSLKEELFLPEETQNGIIDQTDFPIKAEGWVQVVR